MWVMHDDEVENKAVWLVANRYRTMIVKTEVVIKTVLGLLDILSQSWIIF